MQGEIMKKILFGKTGNYYKANMHTHTNISDGSLSPEEIKAEYQKRGYSIVAYTDHDIMICHNDLCDDKFLAINSHEIEMNNSGTGPNFSFMKTYHLNFYAKKPNLKLSPVFCEKRVWVAHTRPLVTDEMRTVDCPAEYSVESMNNLIKIANENGFFVSYNHPVWSVQNYEDYIDLKGLWGVEVYNTESALAGFYDNEQPYVDLIRKSNRVFPLATDDTHNPKAIGGGWIVVDAENLEYETVTKALIDGDFYASNGPSIEKIYMEGEKLFVECSDVAMIRLETERRFANQYERGDQPLTSGCFDLSVYLSDTKKRKPEHTTPYVKITLVDKNGKRAFSRPYYLEDLIDKE